jgi:LEA14-like dessication related protein
MRQNKVIKYLKIVCMLTVLCLQFSCVGWIVEKPSFVLREVSLTLHSMKELKALLTVSVNNPNPYDLTVTSVDCRIFLRDKEAGKGFLTEPIRVPKASQTEIKIPLTAEFGDLGPILKSYLAGKDVPYRIEGTVHVKVLWGRTEIPLAKEGHLNIKS